MSYSARFVPYSPGLIRLGCSGAALSPVDMGIGRGVAVVNCKICQPCDYFLLCLCQICQP